MLLVLLLLLFSRLSTFFLLYIFRVAVILKDKVYTVDGLNVFMKASAHDNHMIMRPLTTNSQNRIFVSHFLTLDREKCPDERRSFRLAMMHSEHEKVGKQE